MSPIRERGNIDSADIQKGQYHRGRYHADKYRRSFMLTYTGQVPVRDYFSMQPWVQEPNYLDGLTPDARSFFEQFAETYRDFWQAAPVNT